MKLGEYGVIILDCDGVIFDSNLLKINAFRKALCQYDPAIVEDFINYFKNNFGASRYRLLEVFVESFLGEKFNQDKYSNILRCYAQECVELYKSADFTSRLVEFLDQHKGKTLYIASGSDGLELENVFVYRGIAQYFKGIYGSPVAKTEIVGRICSRHPNEKILMIGDAKSDMVASNDNGIDFIFMRRFSTSQEMRENTNVISVDDLGDFL